MRFLPAAVASCLLVTGICFAVDAPPPEPEQYVEAGQYVQYAKVAADYVRDHPDSPTATRVAMDLLITATVLDDQPSAMQMRKVIIVNYPTSVQAKYLIGTTADAGAFAGMMGDIAAEGFESITPAFASHYDLAMRLGVARFGAAALGSGPFLVRSFILCGIAGDGQLEKTAVEILNASGARGELWRRILIILTDTTSTNLAKLNYLHALPGRPEVAPFERYVIDHLSAADRATPAVTQIEADDLLDANRLADALPLLAKLPTPSEARVLFWQAWASAATGDTAAAQKLFDQLHHDYPTDPWAAEASDLASTLAPLDSSLAKNVEAALSASRRLKAGADVMEMTADVTRSDGQKLSVYLAIDSGKLMELAIRRDGALAMIYRATDQDGELYFQGSTMIARFTKPALLPAPRFEMARAGNDFVFRGDMHFVANFDDLKTSLIGLVGSQYLSTREGLQDLLASYVRHGNFPLPPQSGPDGTTVYQWVSPAVTKTAISRVSFTVASDGAITSVQTPDFTISHLRYGPAGAFTPDAPAMPDLKLVDRGPMDGGIVQQVLPAVYSLFSPPPSTQPTGAPMTMPATKPAAQ